MKTVVAVVIIVLCSVAVGYYLSLPNEVNVNVSFSDEPIYVVPEFNSRYSVTEDRVKEIVGGFREAQPLQQIEPKRVEPNSFRPLDY